MSRWQNFHIWRGRLPHWRADDVTYYATFRHRRPLTESECGTLFRNLLRTEGRAFDLTLLCVRPETSELIFRVRPTVAGATRELSKTIEAAKRRAGKAIVKATGELHSPFWEETFDRIIRDDAELEERFDGALQALEREELADDYPWIYVGEGDAK